MGPWVMLLLPRPAKLWISRIPMQGLDWTVSSRRTLLPGRTGGIQRWTIRPPDGGDQVLAFVACSTRGARRPGSIVSE